MLETLSTPTNAEGVQWIFFAKFENRGLIWAYLWGILCQEH